MTLVLLAHEGAHASAEKRCDAGARGRHPVKQGAVSAAMTDDVSSLVVRRRLEDRGELPNVLLVDPVRVRPLVDESGRCPFRDYLGGTSSQ